MTETILTVVQEVAKCFVSSLGPYFGYLCSHRRNFDDLSEGVGKLKVARDRVRRKVDDALKNVEEIEPEVREWQRKVESTVDEAEELIDKAKGNNRCFKGSCPDLKTRYKHSKEASTKMEAIARLLREEEKFVIVSYPVVHEDVRFQSTKDFEAFESRSITLKNIMDALNDGNVRMVGVYGMGGIGKTTLVNEVGRQAKKDKLFDELVFVEISENPNVKKIQEEIAGKLGLVLSNQATESQRANKLYARLKNEKILLILDNIWTVDLDLEAIGIPSEGRCKFLLTSRDRDVLEYMGSQSFLIDVLNEEESWKLFKKMVGDYIENPELKSVATDVVKECAGLPVAIVTVAKALRSDKELSEWKDALRELRKPSPGNFRGVLEKAYSKIEFSYNKLKDDKLRETFLLCSLMENNAPISRLLRYVIGLNILGRDIPKMEDARNRVKKWVRQLKDSCLLLDGDTRRRTYYSAYDPHEFFSMHDVVRSIAISIAYRDQHVFTERNDDLREWPDEDELRKCMKISLLDASTAQPPEVLECPELQFFYWSTKNSSFKIPENFFMGMAKLGVLDFTNMKLSSLPSSLCHLLDLQTLCLDNCTFGDNVDKIGQLKKLKILSLKGSDVTRLPKEIGQLTQLRWLDLSYCSKLKVIAPNVISSLSRLEELYMIGCCVQWEVEGSNIKERKASLDELKDLPRLTSLEVEIKDDNILPKDLFSRELQSYNISIGDVRWSSMFRVFKTSRTLKLKLICNISLKELRGFKNVEGLYLDELKEVKNILYELDEEGLQRLRHLYIKDNPNFDCIFHLRDSKPYGAFPTLESLFLDNLINLKKLCYSQLTKESLRNLKIIGVSGCSKLENIFSFSSVECLPQLEEIEVDDCQNMKEIFASEDRGNENEVINKFELRQLRLLSLWFLPQLASFYSEMKTPSTSLFNKKVVLPNLDVLHLDGINSENIWDNQLPIMSCWYQNLTRLELQSCKRLKYAFPSSIVGQFEELQHLDISNCRVLKAIVAKDGDAEAAAAIIFPRLTYLRLRNLPELETGIQTLKLPILKELEVGHIDKIKVLSSEDDSSHENNSLCLKINRNLEELTLEGKSIVIMSGDRFPENYFRFQVVRLYYDESTNIPLGILQRFNSMEKLDLDLSWYRDLFSCAEVEKYVVMLAQLKILVLSNLYDLKCMWKQYSKLDTVLQNLEILKVLFCDKLISLVPSMASFRSLTALEVACCNGLTHVVTSLTAKGLEQLREMKIESCKMMVEVVADEGDVENREIVFKKLKKLLLTELSSLKVFCSGNICTFNFPSLEELIVRNCPMMNTFYRGGLNTPGLLKVKQYESENKGCWEGDINTTIQLHRTKINPKSEELALSGNDIKMLSQGQFPEHYSCGIKVLEVINDESMSIPHKILHRFNNLEKLILTMTSYKEIFLFEEGEKQDGILMNIKKLELWGLSKLIELWRQDSQLKSILPNLEFLSVRYCHNLISVVPSLASFENLTTLEVSYCDGVRNSLTSLTAKSLVQLRRMEIQHCEMMVEVLANEDDVAKDEIVFSKLKDLKLQNLESLTSFCSGNLTFKFPSLEELTVTKCPKMKTFSEGVLSTPSLRKVKQLHWGLYEEYWEGDLNTSIQQLHKKQNNVQSCEKDLGETLVQILNGKSESRNMLPNLEVL